MLRGMTETPDKSPSEPPERPDRPEGDDSADLERDSMRASMSLARALSTY
jgi:hypothetical protein